MEKRVTLKLHDGDLETGFSVSLQIGDEGASPTAEILGGLPAAQELELLYQRWQLAYRQLGLPLRLGVSRVGFATNVSHREDCHNLAEKLQYAFNQWLRSEIFRPIQDKLLERLNPDDTIRLIVQTQQDVLQRLPWHLWDICDRYPKLEIALSAPVYEKKTSAPPMLREQIRILAVFGDSQGLDIKTDLALLNHLSNTEVCCLTEPDRQTLDAHLWDTQGWDILFFAGHSATQTLATPIQPNRLNTKPDSPRFIGQLFINSADIITIPQLKNALRSALARGLKIAIFNSCDGLGLAQALADLQIPQILVMQEVVPDQVAHAFLTFFLDAFARGESFYLAVREAREKLQGLEDRFPCAAWLPTIYQNPADSPPTWHTIIARSSAPTNIITPIPIDPVQSVDHRASRKSRFLKMFSHAVSIFVILGLRQLGLFQHLELKAFDQFMHLRAREAPDSRFLIVTVTDADIQAQPDKYRRGSLSDKALLALMKALETMEPRVIGLDIYRDFLVQPQYPELASMLATHDNFLAVCKSRDSVTGSAAIAPPPEVSDERVGFSDFLVDTDGGVRRQLLAMKPEPSSSCTTEYSFGALLALNYLAVEEVITKASPQGYLQINDLIFTPITDSQGSYQNVDARGQQLLLNYRSLARPDQIADSVTLTEVLAGDVNPESVRDRIVLIGTTDISYGDLWLTPYSKSSRAEDQTSGVFMQAQMASHLISAVLDDRPLIKTWPDWGELVWLLLWGCIGSLLIAGWRKHQHYTLSRYILSLLATELSLFGTCWLLLSRYYYWVPWAPPTALLLIIFGILPIYEHLLLSPSKVNIKEAL